MAVGNFSATTQTKAVSKLFFSVSKLFFSAMLLPAVFVLDEIFVNYNLRNQFIEQVLKDEK